MGMWGGALACSNSHQVVTVEGKVAQHLVIDQELLTPTSDFLLTFSRPPK